MDHSIRAVSYTHLDVYKRQGDDAIDVEWKKVTKLIFYKSVAVIYTGKNNAFLIPSAAMGTQREEIMNFIKEMKKR